PLRLKIAQHFAASGVAALVYDSPGTGMSAGNALVQTLADRVMEAMDALDYLSKMPGIRSPSVGLFGGSEGANVALLAAAGEPRCAFVIAVSSALGVSVLDVLKYSAEKKGLQQDLTPEEITQAATFKEVAFVLLSGVALAEWPLIETRVKRWNDNTWHTLISIAKQRMGELTREEKQEWLDSFRNVIDHFRNERWFVVVDPGNAVQRMAALDADSFFALLESGRFTQDWNKSLCGASGIQCPLLAIWGQEDSFLPPQQSALRLGKELTDANHPDFAIKMFPQATHFLTVPGSAAEFVPGYLDTMTEWLGRHFDLKK
ncbi:MAG: CocE/NonD family hydrolase, partial [Candidatus Latescibacterota bacterium]